MKKFLALAVAVLLAFGASAQVQKGEMILGVNIGLGNTIYPTMKALPPITLEYEHGLLEGLFDIDGFCLGVGGILAYTEDYSNEYKYSSVIVAAKGYLHYDFSDLEELDIYATVSLGWNITSTKDPAPIYPFPLFYDVSIGARYWFTDSFAANLESGYGLSWLKAGINFRF